MRNRRLRPGTAAAGLAVGLILFMAAGCSHEEPIDPDNPFLTSSGMPTAAGQTPGLVGRAGKTAAVAAADEAVDPSAPLRADDVERQLRIALRAAERGETARAAALLDRILALEPINREALSGRAAIEVERSRKAASPEERSAAMDRALELVRTLRRAYEKPNKAEIDLLGRMYYAQARLNVDLGRDDRAVAAIKDSYDAGLDQLNRVEADPAMARLRETPAYRAMVKGIDDANLAMARQRLKNIVDKPLPLDFSFSLSDLDGRPLSLDQFRGKVVLIDFWGTWCKPCRDALPGLSRLYLKNRRRGLEVVGLDYEPNAPDPALAPMYVKKFAQEAGIPYHIAMGDDATREKVHLESFPTTMLIDRAGKVRVLVTQNTDQTLPMLADAIEVLLAEPEPGAAGAKEAAGSPAEPRAKESPKAASPAPAEPKGTAAPK